MTEWDFVTAAYVLTGIATIILVGVSWASMRRAEAAVDAVRKP